MLLPYWNAAAVPGHLRQRGGRPRPSAAARQPGRTAARRAARCLTGGYSASSSCLVGEVTANLEEFRPATAGARIAGFIDALANWYLPRSRRRLRQDPATADGAAAFATLRDCLNVLTRVMAPLAPFLTDYVWTLIRDGETGDPDSVHLTSWPHPEAALIDRQLASQVAVTRRLAGLGCSARSAAGVSVRQPLARALVAGDQAAGIGAELRAQLADGAQRAGRRAAAGASCGRT